jgi:transglutaminase-like putative cysteine protease
VGEPGETSVDAVYLQPNAMITSNDARVRDLTRKAVGSSTDPWEKAKKIEQYVADSIRDKNFRVAFAPASEVAQNLEGDCTEHGVLTAAMCRAAGVPARVAVGLVYAEPLGGFGFHLWNEVYVNRRWVAIDATFKQDEVDAVHIKLSDSSLDGVSPFDAFMPIVRVLGKMTLDPVEVH